MENKEVAKSEFIPLARKSRASRIIMPIQASIGFILTIFLIGGGKSLEMILLTLFVAIVGFIAPSVVLYGRLGDPKLWLKVTEAC